MAANVNNPYLPPLFPRWNVAVLRMMELTCPRGYDVRPMAPGAARVALDGGMPFGSVHAKAPDCLEAQQAWVRRHGRVCVDGRHSLLTIYGSPEVNYAFRAWHEATHIRLGQPFTPAGERAVCGAQQADVAKVFGRRDAFLFAHILHCEIIEQAEEYQRTGRFPHDQRAFTLARLDPAVTRELGGADAALERTVGNGMVRAAVVPHGAGMGLAS